MDIFQSTYSFIVPFCSIKMINLILYSSYSPNKSLSCDDSFRSIRKKYSELVILQKILQNISTDLWQFPLKTSKLNSSLKILFKSIQLEK